MVMMTMLLMSVLAPVNDNANDFDDHVKEDDNSMSYDKS